MFVLWWVGNGHRRGHPGGECEGAVVVGATRVYLESRLCPSGPGPASY
jgi:hypothetical protein